MNKVDKYIVVWNVKDVGVNRSYDVTYTAWLDNRELFGQKRKSYELHLIRVN